MSGARLGDILLAAGRITSAQLEAAIQQQRGTGRLLGEVLVESGTATAEDVAQAIARQLDIPYMELGDEFVVGPEDVQLVPETIARRFCLLPQRGEDAGVLTLIMRDPVDIEAIDAVRSITDLDIRKAIAVGDRIQAAITKFYRVDAHVEHSLRDIASTDDVGDEAAVATELDIADRELRDLANDAPVVRFVNLILIQAVRDRASDIHFEPGEKTVTVRLRIDGVLREVTPPPKALYRGIVTRIKILSDMDISERRLPLDGRFKFNAQGRSIDVRVSSLPLVHGEKMVLRILDRGGLLVDLDEIGMEPELLMRYKRVLGMPNGIVLLTGPTGSGKTTTLYAAMSYLRSPERNIQTVEDPVEYLIDGVNQMQIRPQIGLDFASCLRSILRQDPDIIMIGEVRDMETSRIAMRASLTGHLVLSTLHTNDAPSAFSRLVDIGIEPYLIAATVRCVIAQRLVRVICAHCRKEGPPPADAARAVRPACPDIDAWVHLEGTGCYRCGGSGFRGRRAIFGYLEVNDPIREMIVDGTGEVEFRRRATEQGAESLLQNGLKKVRQGVTTLPEVVSECPDTDFVQV